MMVIPRICYPENMLFPQNVQLENSNYDWSDLVKKAFRTQFNDQHRNRQYRLQIHFKKFSSKEEIMRHPPTSVKENELEISQRNRGNHTTNDTPPAVGSISIARIVDDLTKKEGKEPTMIDQYEICHYSRKKGKIVSDKAQRTLHEEFTSSNLLAEICENKLHHIPSHVKGWAISERPVIAIKRLRTEVEVERKRADDVVEQNAAITTKVTAQEAEVNALKEHMLFLIAEITRLSSQQSKKC